MKSSITRFLYHALHDVSVSATEKESNKGLHLLAGCLQMKAAFS